MKSTLRSRFLIVVAAFVLSLSSLALMWIPVAYADASVDVMVWEGIDESEGVEKEPLESDQNETSNSGSQRPTDASSNTTTNAPGKHPELSTGDAQRDTSAKSPSVPAPDENKLAQESQESLSDGLQPSFDATLPVDESASVESQKASTIASEEPDQDVSEELASPERVDDGTALDSEADEPALEAQASQPINVYRLYNPNSGEHFYTVNLNEAKGLATLGWHWEGIGWAAPKSGDPVYRLYNPNAGDHHYTVSKHERDWLITLGWRYEGIGWYSDKNKTLAVLRQYNPNSRTGSHNFTINRAERNKLASLGWKTEGVGWYAAGQKASNVTPFWIRGLLGNQWVQRDGTLAKNRLVTPKEGAGCYALITKKGVAQVGRFKDAAGRWCLADSLGKLESSTGWLVSSAYDGRLQRYYMERTSEGYAVCRIGRFYLNGLMYEGIASKGYVERSWLGYVGNIAYGTANDGSFRKLTSIERKVLNACLKFPSPGGGLCALWVTQVAQGLNGGRRQLGNANELYWDFCKSSDRSALKPGMAVGVSTHGHTRLGRIYGHVAIYVGQGLVMDNVGYIRTMRLDDWIAYYSDIVPVRWGWISNKAVS